MKCNCHPQNPFHWRDEKRPSIFALDPSMRASLSQNQTMVVERERLNGRDISQLPGMKNTISRLNIKQFSVYTRATVSKP